MKKTRGRRQASKKSVFRFWLISILVLLVGGLLVKVFLNFQHVKLASFSRLNFVLLTSQNQIFVLSLEGQEGLVLTLAASEKVNVPRGFGEYELGKVYGLGELEKRGGQLLQETVGEVLQAPVFGYFSYPQNLSEKSWEKPKSFLEKIFWEAFWGRVKTNLKKQDLALLYWRASRLNEDLCRVKKTSGPTENLFQDRRLREESLSIEILNATNHNGLAQQAAQFLEKVGGRVVRTADAKQEGNCRILVRRKAQNYTSQWLSRIFQCPLQESESSLRADLVLILGENYWKRWSERW